MSKAEFFLQEITSSWKNVQDVNLVFKVDYLNDEWKSYNVIFSQFSYIVVFLFVSKATSNFVMAVGIGVSK